MGTKQLTALSAVLLLGLVCVDASAKDDVIRLKCKASSADGTSSISARHVTRIGARRTRQIFKSSFEAAPGFGYDEGDVLQVNVSGNIVGTMRLAYQVNGDLGGDLDFDTNIDADQPDTSIPFPANWPGAEEGTVVMIGTLGCSLQD